MNRLSVAARLLTGSFTPFAVPFWGREERALVSDWLGGVSFPDALMRLEQAIISQLGQGHSVRLLNFGRSAIQFALESMKFCSSGQVLLPSFCCASVVMSVIQANLRPVLVDVDEQFNIRFESVLEADSPNVKAVIVPHLSGCWARDTEKILDWARSRNVFVIEDCAQATGLARGGRPAGTFGDAGVFSCGMGKPLFGPGGGWLVSRRPDVIQSMTGRAVLPESRENVSSRIRDFLCNYTITRERRSRKILAGATISKLFDHHSSRTSSARNVDIYRFPMYAMSDLEAQLALLQMRKIAIIVQMRRVFASRWEERLTKLGWRSIRLLPDQDNMFAKMLISFVGDRAEEESGYLRGILWEHGVEVEASYTPLHLCPLFENLRRSSMPVTERQWRGVFAVPVRPNLGSADWKRIDKALSRIANIRRRTQA